VVTIRCARCGADYAAATPDLAHNFAGCLDELTRERDELRAYLASEGPEHLRAENKSLRSALARSENEKAIALDSLSRVQARCTELLEEVRALKGPRAPG